MQSNRKKLVGTKARSKSKAISGFLQPLVALVLFTVFAGSLIALFASRAQEAPQTTSQTNGTTSDQSFTPTLTAEATSASNITTEWQTFSNDRSPITLRLPKDWTSYDLGKVDTNTKALFAFSPDSSISVPRPYENTFQFAVLSLQITSRQFEVEREIADNNIGGKEEKITLSGIQGVKRIGGINPTGKKVTVVILPVQDGTAVLTCLPAFRTEDYTSICDSMISSVNLAK